MKLTFIKSKWIILAVLLVATVALTAFKIESGKAPQYYTEKVQQGDIQNVVQATGSITAVTTVQVGSQVSGTIQKLAADFNSHVTQGQVIAQIDPALFEGALLQAKADLQDAIATLATAKANLAKAEATEAQTHQDYSRYGQLAKDGVVPQQQFDSAKAAWQSATADVAAAKAAITQDEAVVQQKTAAVTVAQTNLNYTTIRSPIDGTVVARNVDVGQTVAASLQAPTLFTIAKDLTKMQVYVSTDESDVGAIHVGQTASFKVDAFPDLTFKGRVSQVRLNAATVQNVVTYTTVVDFDNPQMKLFPGMTAYVSIPVAQVENVIKIPNGALRFKPQAAGQPAQAKNTGGTARQPQSKDPTLATVWKLAPDKSLQPVQIKLGITDHSFTQVAGVLSGTLNPGDQLIVGSAGSANSGQPKAASAPGMAGGRGMGGLGR